MDKMSLEDIKKIFRLRLYESYEQFEYGFRNTNKKELLKKLWGHLEMIETTLEALDNKDKIIDELTDYIENLEYENKELDNKDKEIAELEKDLNSAQDEAIQLRYDNGYLNAGRKAVIDKLKEKIGTLNKELKGLKGNDRYLIKQQLGIYVEILNFIERGDK